MFSNRKSSYPINKVAELADWLPSKALPTGQTQIQTERLL
jgi:hypothetical protein